MRVVDIKAVKLPVSALLYRSDDGYVSLGGGFSRSNTFSRIARKPFFMIK
jgi:hypothetical protein